MSTISQRKIEDSTVSGGTGEALTEVLRQLIEKQLLRVLDAAEVAGIGKTMAYEFVQAGIWPSVKIGRVLRVPRSGLQRWISEREVEADERAAGLRVEA